MHSTTHLTFRAGTGAALIAALLVGCSSGDGGGDSSSSDRPVSTVALPPAGTGAGPTNDELTAALLTVDELPEGFTVTPTLEDYGLPEPEGSDHSTTQPASCASVLAPVAVQVSGASGAAEAAYTGGDFLTIDESIAGYTADAVPAAFETIQSTVAECGEFTGTDADGIDVQYRVVGGPEPTGLPESAQSVLTFRLETTSEGITLITDAVVAAVGNSILQLTAGGLDPIGDDVLTGLATTAIEKAAATPEA